MLTGELRLEKCEKGGKSRWGGRAPVYVLYECIIPSDESGELGLVPQQHLELELPYLDSYLGPAYSTGSSSGRGRDN